MKIVEIYSHLNGLEYLQVHLPELWEEIKEVIESVDAEVCKTKKSKEKNKVGKLLYSPIEMNKNLKSYWKIRVGEKVERNIMLLLMLSWQEKLYGMNQ